MTASNDKNILKYLININTDREECENQLKNWFLCMELTRWKTLSKILFENEWVNIKYAKNYTISSDYILNELASIEIMMTCNRNYFSIHLGIEQKLVESFLERINAEGGIHQQALEVGLVHSYY